MRRGISLESEESMLEYYRAMHEPLYPGWICNMHIRANHCTKLLVFFGGNTLIRLSDWIKQYFESDPGLSHSFTTLLSLISVREGSCFFGFRFDLRNVFLFNTSFTSTKTFACRN